ETDSQSHRSRSMSIRSAMLATSLLTVSQVTAGEPVTLQFEEPSLDRWNYPFNQTNGVKPIASVFGAFEEDGLSPLFDNRDAQFLVGFSTAEDVPPGLGPQSYFISAATLTVMVASHNSFQYETELQPWRNFVPPNSAVPPLELYGAGFRNGFTPVTYQENSSYSPMGSFGKGHRTAYPIDRDFSEGPVDVSNNVDLGFDPWPLSIGTTTAAAPGELVPQGAVFTFELDTADPHVQAYLREAVDHGI